MSALLRFLHTIKPLRVVLALLGMGLMFLRPVPGAGMELEGWAVVSTLLAPALAPIVFMLFMLDALMSRVLMVGQESLTEKARHKRIMIMDLIIGISFLAYWLPYFSHLVK